MADEEQYLTWIVRWKQNIIFWPEFRIFEDETSVNSVNSGCKLHPLVEFHKEEVESMGGLLVPILIVFCLTSHGQSLMQSIIATIFWRSKLCSLHGTKQTEEKYGILTRI